MFSSYATITPCSFFPSFNRISSACAALAKILAHTPAKSSAATPGTAREPLAVFMSKVCARHLSPARLTPPVVSGVPTPPGWPQFALLHGPVRRAPRPPAPAPPPATAHDFAAAPAHPPASAAPCDDAGPPVPTAAPSRSASVPASPRH